MASVKGKNVAESGVLPFAPTSYGTEEAISSIALLSSPEEIVVLKAIYNLCKYGQERISNVKYLYELGIMDKLLHLLRTCANQSIINFVLKLMATLMNFPEAIEKLTDVENYGDILKISSIFQNTTDQKILEFSSEILSKAVVNTMISSLIFNTDIVGPIFKVLENSNDPDVIRNTLLFLYKIIDCQEAEIVLPVMNEFSPKILFCFLKSDFPEIQHMAIDVLLSTTSWKNQKLQIRYKTSGVVENMLKLIMNNEYPDLHQKSFDVIRNCFDNEETATYFVGTVEFLEFALWAKTCPKKYMLPAATIFKILTDHESVKQLLFDFSVEESILFMFRTNNEKVLEKTCEAISNLTSHKYCSDKMLTPVVIKSLIEIINRSDIPTIPYIETALKTIHKFLNRNRKMLHFFPMYDGLIAISSLFKNQNEMTHHGFNILLDIIYRYCYENDYRSILVDKELYMKFLQLYTEEDEEFSRKAIAILDQCSKDEECRVTFLECSGPEMILDRLKDSSKDEHLLKYSLLFISRIFIYKKIGMEFLMHESVSVLKKLKIKDEETKLMKKRLIDMMYDLYLPLKFYEKGRLDVTDYIRDSFYLICGNWTGTFPFLEVLESQQIVTCKTIYVADFTSPSDLLKKARLFCPAASLPKQSIAAYSSKSQTSGQSKVLPTASKAQRISVSSSNVCNIIFENVNPELNYGGLSPDPYLTQYLEELYVKLYGEKVSFIPIRDQIKMVAEYIHRHMSGSEWFPEEEWKHSYKLHINTLKEKLGTNTIPIGYVRQGSYCERALLFKVLADKLAIPCSLVKGKGERHWNEVPLEIRISEPRNLTFYVVDLMKNVGNLLKVGSKEAAKYCGKLSNQNCN